MMQAKFKKYTLVFSTAAFLSLFFFLCLSFDAEQSADVSTQFKDMFKKEVERVRILNQKTNTENIHAVKNFPKRDDKKIDEKTPIKPLADDSDMKNGSVCFQLEKISTRAEEKLTEQNAKLSSQRLEAAQKKAILAKTIDDKREARRDAWNVNFNKRFDAIMKSAKTSEQQVAAKKFEAVVNQAIADRRSQIDKATEDFRNGMNISLYDQKMKIDAAVSAYNTTVQVAGDAAQTKCGDATSVTSARDDFKTALQTARKNFEANRAAIEKGKTTTQTLTNAHATAIEMANNDFKTKIEAAAEDLKAVLKK